jgi:MoaA/NifB/PqqE/SkfB family radical SAM enzyme
MQNKTFCVAPWVHMHIEPTGDVQLCCASNWKHDFNRSLGNLNNSTPLEIWNSDQYKHVRTSMIKGKMLDDYCSPCYLRENGAVNQTERQRLNSDFSVGYDLAKQTNSDGSVNTLDIRYLDIRFNNLCNLKCRTCGPDWSTSWANELGIEKPLRYNNSWKKLLPYLSNLEKVYFAGGEPMMTSEHYDFLEHLLDVNPNVELLYTSNFTRLELNGRHVMDYWPKFKLVSAIASVDHYGEYAAYVRSSSRYNEVIANIKEIKSSGYTNIQPAITTVYSLYNATKIGDFILRLFEDNVIESMNQIVFNLLVNPEFQMATVMPEAALESAKVNTSKGIDYLVSRGEDPQKLVNAITWLTTNHKYDKDKFTKFLNYNLQLDKLRNTSLESLYKEFF